MQLWKTQELEVGSHKWLHSSVAEPKMDGE